MIVAVVMGPALAQTSAKDVVVAAVRDRGHACTAPVSAEPDAAHSSTDEKTWVIRCREGRYRVKFQGDTGAKVEPIKGPGR